MASNKYLKSSAIISIEPKYMKRSSAYEQKRMSIRDDEKTGIDFNHDTTRLQLVVRVLIFDRVTDKEHSLATYTLNVIGGTNILDIADGDKNIFIKNLLDGHAVITDFTIETAEANVSDRIQNKFISVVKSTGDEEGTINNSPEVKFNGRTSISLDAVTSMSEDEDSKNFVLNSLQNIGNINDTQSNSYFVSEEIGTIPVPELSTSLDDAKHERFDDAKTYTLGAINDEIRVLNTSAGGEVSGVILESNKNSYVTSVGDIGNLSMANSVTDVVRSVDGQGPLQTIIAFADDGNIMGNEDKTFSIKTMITGNVFIREDVDTLTVDMREISYDDVVSEFMALIGNEDILDTLLENYRLTSVDGNHFDGVSENGMTGSGYDLLVVELIEKSVIYADYSNNNGKDNFVASLLEIVTRVKQSRKVLSMTISFDKDSNDNISINCDVTNASYGTYNANHLDGFDISESLIRDIANENIYLPSTVSYVEFIFSDGLGVHIEGIGINGIPFLISTTIEDGFLAQTQTSAHVNFAGI